MSAKISLKRNGGKIAVYLCIVALSCILSENRPQRHNLNHATYETVKNDVYTFPMAKNVFQIGNYPPTASGGNAVKQTENEQP